MPARPRPLAARLLTLPLLIAAASLSQSTRSASDAAQSAAQGGAPPAAAAAQPSPPPGDDLVVTYPPGAVAVFPAALGAEGATGGRLTVELKGRGMTVLVEDGVVEFAAGDGGGRERRVAFVVPQVPAGTYEASFRFIFGRGASARPLLIRVEPRLVARAVHLRGKPGETLEVEAGLPPEFVAELYAREPARRDALVTLTSTDLSVVRLAPGQAPRAATDEDGFAKWKVRIERVGRAALEASAAGFEPVSIIVEGAEPASAAAEASLAELRGAEAELALREEEARRLDSRLGRLEAEARMDEPRGPGGRPSEAVLRKQRMRQDATAEAQRAHQSAASAESAARLSVLSAETRAAPYAPALAAPARLLPGDVLLVQGRGFVSDRIRSFERAQLSAAGLYSHAILYLGPMRVGERDVPMVAEMLAAGYWLRPLSASLRDAELADVYRWRDPLTAAQREQIALRGRTMFGDPEQFVRLGDPSRRDALLALRRGSFYAYPQIGLLAAAAAGASDKSLRDAADGVDLINGGKRGLICSELVAWAYREAGLDPQVTRWWPALELSGVFRSQSDDRRRDYTTPNMLSLTGGKFVRVARLPLPLP